MFRSVITVEGNLSSTNIYHICKYNIYIKHSGMISKTPSIILL